MEKIEAAVIDSGPFTPCEVEIVRRLCEGESNKIIAAGLNNSIRTVDAHIQTIYEKLHLRNLSINTRCVAILTLVAKGYVRLSVKALAVILLINALQFDDQAMLLLGLLELGRCRTALEELTMFDIVRSVGWLVVGLSFLGLIMLIFFVTAIIDDLLGLLERALNES